MQQYYIVFYSHVNYSVTKIMQCSWQLKYSFYSHVNYSVTKIESLHSDINRGFTVT